MLFASTRLTLIRELGGEHFTESVFCTEADELSEKGWEKHVKHTESANPLTAEEQSLQDIKEAEALESRGTRGQGLAQGVAVALGPQTGEHRQHQRPAPQLQPHGFEKFGVDRHRVAPHVT